MMRGNVFIKILAFILCSVTLMTLAFSVIGAAVMVSAGFYTRPLDSIRKDALHDTLREYAHNAAAEYFWGGDMESFTESKNVYFEIYDAGLDGEKKIYSNYDGRDIVFSEDFYYEFTDCVFYFPESQYEDTVMFPNEENPVTSEYETAASDSDRTTTALVTYGVHEESMERYLYAHIRVFLPYGYKTIDMVSFIDGCVNFLSDMSYSIYIVGGSAFLLFIASLILLCMVSGWKTGEKSPRASAFDRIPFDIFTLIYITIAVICVLPFTELYLEGLEIPALVIGLVILGSVLVISYIRSIAVRIKTGEIFRNTLIAIIFRYIINALRFVFRALFRIFTNLPIYGKTLAGVLVSAVWCFIALNIFSYGDVELSVFLWIVLGTILSALAFYITYMLDKIFRGGERIAGGDIGYKVDTRKMLPVFKRHAESLNNIGGGMSLALESKLKSERFKTELITNVSHDLKTPLTSIVNYIDLIKTERNNEVPDQGKLTEYVEVLDRQSARLRKLTEDLVEASKAQTGNLEVNPTIIELGEMIAQTEGEYGEKLSALDLKLIVNSPEKPISVYADGKHLFRIFDNLMNNICKYALEGTRVYINITEHDGIAYVIFRNTSKYELKASGDELTERFVRGDASRHTEGSGLGLSIARSLAELNGARLDIYTDGDLFKVVIEFKSVPGENQ
ncbi:MAG: histidine kinase dimerization/phospho-acceptor domain-containing protein [Clostridia bacterium]|nr:histidine kinase dimerization/phospho-acceptor domain-containing protein [Clostridia bacterium]